MIKKYLYMALGFFCVGMAYVGFVVPGIPFSIFLVIAAWAFAKSSKRMHDWIYNHKLFGPFLTNWTTKRIFPYKLKWVMLITMATTVAFTYFSTGNEKAALYTGIFMILVAVWAWRYPDSEAEYEKRKKLGKKIAWLK